jgi:hypothetical protein
MRKEGSQAQESKSASPSRLAPVLPALVILDQLSLNLAQRLNTRRTKSFRDQPAFLEDFHLLNVDVPLGAGGLLGPGPVVAELRTFAAAFALSHNNILPNQNSGRTLTPDASK